MKYTPVFEREGQRFLIANPDYLANNEDKAHEIGIGEMFYGGLMLGFKLAEVDNVIKVPESEEEGSLTAEQATLTNKSGGGYSVYLNPKYCGA